MPKTIDVPERVFRSGEITHATREGEAEASNEIEFSFSSEEPYRRWWGTEILGHRDGEVDTGFVGSGNAPLLVDHKRDVDSQIGIITRVWIENGKGRARVRFGKARRAVEILERVQDGELKNISVGYEILRMRLEGEEEGEETYRVTSWKPHEISIVTIPADPTVGIGRNAQSNKSIEINGDQSMPNENPVPAPEPVPAAPAVETRSEPPVNADEIRRAERERVATITAIGSRFNMGDRANEAIAGGTSVAAFNQLVITELGERAPEVASARTEVGLTPREKKNYSFLRAIRALANPTDRRAQEEASFEFEVSEAESGRSGRTAKGILIPSDILSAPMNGTREQSVATATAGGNVVANTLMSGSFIEILRNKMMVRKLGATVMNDMAGTFDLPRQSGSAGIFWGSEGDDAAETGYTFDQVSFAPTTASAYIDLTRRFIIQSSIAAESFTRTELATAMALGIDYAALHGSGTGDEPTGIANMTGIGAVVGGTNGAAPTWSDIVNLETEVSVDNADIGSLGYLTNAKVRGKLKETEKAAGTNGIFIWPEGRNTDGFGSLNGYRAGVSNQVSSTLSKGSSTNVASAMFFGNWADLIIATWSGVDILIDPYTKGLAGGLRVIIHQDVDVKARRPESFSAMLDALTA
ncbi:phage major capsid protein [Hoeflea sp. WL0058]|uniref:Phage major capsid protein n=1 Tax=Flavimaribacter sediminis TaxID=2865987 RepID=A0AAE3D319_9HYPH|nr:phage major capsid protein [Flavimaribacter sediminis]MBW8640389.1 phage major capsid protein [Flavimaribacter sediminis]